jgi:hypothetical protein
MKQVGAMKLNSAQLKQTLAQFEAQPIPDDHPLLPKLNEMFGHHTFFLDAHGLNVVEPMEEAVDGARAGTIVNVANWSDRAPEQARRPRAAADGGRRDT